MAQYKDLMCVKKTRMEKIAGETSAPDSLSKLLGSNTIDVVDCACVEDD